MRRAERAKFPATGVQDGWPGRLAKVEILDSDGSARQVPVAGRYELLPNQAIRIQGAGAGGFGPPGERDPEAVRRDVESALVSVEGARRDYGVVFAADGSVDTEATARLRAEGLSPPPPVTPETVAREAAR